MSYGIRRVAVLGAGTMGAAIAAHVANTGLPVDLLDIAPTELTPEEAQKGISLDSTEIRNRIVQAGFERMRKSRPPALMSESAAGLIRLGNFAEHLARLREADWILEAVVEELSAKRELMKRIDDLRDPSAIVSSNTSGIPLSKIAEGRSASFREHFLGTHFFNPPRYMRLLEIIPTGDTRPAVVETMRAFAEHTLGKGVVLAKDTPNFIANRIASYAGMQKVWYALTNGYSIEDVDALTGPLIGHPTTATFRLADLVGLDVKLDVAQNLYRLVPDDESRDVLRVPEPLARMREAGLLGNKTGSGFYRRTQRDGQTTFDVLDLDSLTYRPAQRPDSPLLAQAQERKDLAERLRFLLGQAEADRGARFIRDTLLPVLAYAARRVPEISDSLVEIDRAMEWGYSQEAGPFRTWDLLGVPETIEQMNRLGLEVASWVKSMVARGNLSFYRREAGRELVYSPVAERYVPM